MKKMIFALMMMLTASVSANAMSYEQARNEALFLTDKMAYELNLTDEQYEAAYEINLDYLMGVTSRDDVYGVYWERRNLDLSYILLDWQWNAYVAASYFYRPLYWDAGYWHFGIYARYPHRSYLYFGRPHFYSTYRGGHAWHRVGGHGYYHGHSNHFRAHGRSHVGMHDRMNRGEFHGNRHSSTRVTAGNRSRSIERNNRAIERGNRSIERNNRTIERQNRTIERNNRTIERGNRSIERNNRSIERGNSRSIERGNHSIERGSSRSSSFSSPRSSSRSSSFSGGSRSGSHSSGSFSGGSHSSGSRSGGSFSGGSHSHSGGHSGGGHSGGGGHSHGGRR